MDIKPPFYRRNYLINKKLQLRIALAMVIEVALITLTLSLILVYINDYYMGLISYFIGNKEAQQIELSDIGKSIKYFLFGGIGVSSVTFAVIGIFLSHKIAGPLYRLKKNMICVRNGNYSQEIRFRKDDQLHDLAETFNEMSMALDMRKEITSLYVDRVETMLVNLMKDTKPGVLKSELQFTQLINKLTEMSDILSQLKDNNKFIYNDDGTHTIAHIKTPNKNTADNNPFDKTKTQV